MDKSMVDGCIKTFPPLIPDTLMVAFKRKCETEETEGGGEETKVKVYAYDGEIAEKVAMSETMEDVNTEDACPLIPETSAVVSENQHETGETDGGKKKEKDHDNTDNDDGQNFSALVPETWAIASENRCKTQETGGDGEEPKVETNTCSGDLGSSSRRGNVRPKRWKLAARKQRTIPIRATTARRQRSMLIQETLGWKWLSAARKRQMTEMYGSLHTLSGDLGINRGKTQEKESVGEEVRVKANACNEEFAQNMTRDDDGRASHEDPTDVIKTSIKETTTMNESKCLEQGDDRDKGGTCIKPKRLFSEVEQGAMTTGRGKAKKRRMIWWIGWQP